MSNAPLLVLGTLLVAASAFALAGRATPPPQQAQNVVVDRPTPRYLVVHNDDAQARGVLAVDWDFRESSGRALELAPGETAIVPVTGYTYTFEQGLSTRIVPAPESDADVMGYRVARPKGTESASVLLFTLDFERRGDVLTVSPGRNVLVRANRGSVHVLAAGLEPEFVETVY
ncbi:MAG: hypothetical protein R3F34_08820 [Planctomycetota bacterium]